MKALAAALVASLLLTACATRPGGPGTRDYYERRILRANPGKVIATELAFAREAQEKGQWTAFAEFAADDATMFVPEPVNAKDWLKRQVNPPRALTWQPHQVWSSCDGTLAVTKGAWQRPDGSVGYFTTVWERQRDGEYEWVMNQGDELAEPLEAPQMIGAHVADCLPRDRDGASANIGYVLQAIELERTEGQRFRAASDDGTLGYTWEYRPDGGRSLMVEMLSDGAMNIALDVSVAAPSPES